MSAPAPPPTYAIDADGDFEASQLLRKASTDPVTAQREAQELYDGVVDWQSANWSNPLLKQLAHLSALSNHDLPQAAHLQRRLRKDLPADHPVAASSLAGASPQTMQQTAYVPDLELRHADGCSAAGASRMASVYGVPSPSRKERPGVSTEATRPLPHLPSDVEAAKQAPSEKATDAMSSLLHLSPALLESDPALGALVRQIAERRAKAGDPKAAELVSGSITHLPDDVDAARETAAERTRREAARASVIDPNKAFMPSDIVEYPRLAAEAEDEGALVLVDSNRDDAAVTVAAEEFSSPRRQIQLKSMHDVGRETWHQRAVDYGAEDEDAEKFDAYREELTTATGRLLAVEQRTEVNVSQERARRFRCDEAEGKPQMAIEGRHAVDAEAPQASTPEAVAASDQSQS